MPYDPRPTNEGGNRGIDVDFSRCAPKDKFRIVAVDTFDGGDWVDRDCDTLEEAKDYISKASKGVQMQKFYIYNDKGVCMSSAGTF
ncbi:MAG: hypothetical protein DWQ19_09620 [Crenarchaeota archaeon]|nr:MAG: hypothetical protein DWQ19_09620 [Thermoproteota archaeon]